VNYLLIKTKLNNNGANMLKPIQFKKLLLLMLLFSSSTNVFSDQIQKDYINNRWEDSRYTNHNDGTVTDIKTGLMWKQCSEGLSGDNCSAGTATTHTYKDAIEHAGRVTFAGHSDWRLPNIKELASLAAYDRYKPAINSTFFPNTPFIFVFTSSGYKSSFWSSSPDANVPNYAMKLHFSNGNDGNNPRNESLYVRLVRVVQ
jgi:hypothetical protein